MQASPRPTVSRWEKSRQREARSLGGIPARGWVGIFWRTALEFSRGRTLAVAAGISFYVLFAIFPGLAALISLYGLVADPGTIAHQIDNLAKVLPSGVADIVGDQMKTVAARKAGVLGMSFFVGLGVALWSANAGMKALFDALNVVCGEVEQRGIIKLNMTGLLFSVVTALFAGIALAAVVVLPVLLNFIGLGGSAGLLMNVGRWPALFVATTLVLSIVYRYGPSRQAAKWRWVSPGSASAALLWIIVSLLFFLVRPELRDIRQDLWGPRRCRRVHDLDMAIGDGFPPRCRTRHRDGASGRRSHEVGSRQKPQRARCRGGRYRWDGHEVMRLHPEDMPVRNEGDQDITTDHGNAVNWLRILDKYRRTTVLRSAFELFVTAAPFLGLWTLAWGVLSVGYWLSLIVAVPTAIFLVRLFMIQHDCGHGAFFGSAAANTWVGRIIGVATLTPYGFWRRTHATHHATVGNLGHRGVGDIDTLTVAEYLALSFARRLGYRLSRHPAVMFGLVPAYLFLLHYRLPIGLMRAGRPPWFSTMGTNAAIAAVVAFMTWLIGFESFLLVEGPVLLIAASLAVWLFYVQHQFQHTRWTDDEDWRFQEAALHGSSHYDLPPVLAWLTGNIGVHHVHHLSSRIPFYRLRQVLRDHPQLAGIGRVTMIESLRCAKLALWDEGQQRLISFHALSRRISGAAFVGSSLVMPPWCRSSEHDGRNENAIPWPRTIASRLPYL
jgi:omega-6 fatty acid desaturase (delta-12 desaturase)